MPTGVYRVEVTAGSRKVAGDIVIKTIGPGSSPPIAGLRSAVRAHVPRNITVNVVEDSGRTTGL